MESALVTAGFVTGLRTPLSTSNLMKTEQVQRNGAKTIEPHPPLYEVTAYARVYFERNMPGGGYGMLLLLTVI